MTINSTVNRTTLYPNVSTIAWIDKKELWTYISEDFTFFFRVPSGGFDALLFVFPPEALDSMKTFSVKEDNELLVWRPGRRLFVAGAIMRSTK